MILFLSLVIVALIATGQLLLKVGADRSWDCGLINGFVIAGYAVFFLIVIASYQLMAIMPMKNFTVIMSLGYIAVALASRWILKERIDRYRWVGTILIVAGVFIFLM